MMSDKLDNILREWAGKHEPDEKDKEGLATQIVATASHANADEESYLLPVMTVRARLSYAILGAAAAVLVSFVYFHWFSPVGQRVDNNGSVAMLGVISEEQVDARKRLFDEMERIFSGDFKWICESEDDVGIGVETGDIPVSTGPAAAMVRLVVVLKKTGEDDWQTVWNTDVLLREEEMVEVIPNSAKRNKLALWVYPLSDGKVAVDTNLSLDAPVKLASNTQRVAEQGEVAEVMSLRTDEGEYRVLQAVELL